MHRLELHDLGRAQLQLVWQPEAGQPRRAAPTALGGLAAAWDRAELGWLLEAAPGYPSGADRWRWAQAASRLELFGQRLWARIFGSAEARALLEEEASRLGLGRCELRVRTDDPAIAGLPWELLGGPDGAAPLTQQLGGLARQPRQEAASESPRRAGPPRVLLVVVGPGEKRDTPFVPPVRALADLPERVGPGLAIELLRPPTLAALRERLLAEPGRYDVVHLDAPLRLAGPPDDPPTEPLAELDLEGPDGPPEPCPIAVLGSLLAEAEVPLVVLAANQQHEAGIDPTAAAALGLLAGGPAAVLALPYRLTGEATSRYLERWYGALLAGDSLTAATAAARRALLEASATSPAGDPFARPTWLAPALYAREPGWTLPRPERAPAAAAAAHPPRLSPADPPDPGGLVGRDYELLRIEAALRDDDHPWLLLSGRSEVGKSALAAGFGRWYAATGGCPDGLFSASFEQAASLGVAIASLVGYGMDYSRLTERDQWRHLVSYLRPRRCLLIWDGFERFAGLPREGLPPAAAEERAKVARFLRALRGGRTRVLLVSRRTGEEWLGLFYEQLEVGALGQHESIPLAAAQLASVGLSETRFRGDESYGLLLRLLDGSPRGFELVLPRLREASPAALLQELLPRLAGSGEGPRDLERLLTEWVFERLNPGGRDRLPVLGLFSGRVSAETLAELLADSRNWPEALVEALAEPLDTAGWAALLDEAAAAGLLARLGGARYGLPSGTAALLRERLLERLGEAGWSQLLATLTGCYAHWAEARLEPLQTGQRSALEAIEAEEPNLLRALAEAERLKRWSQAQALLESLGQTYAARGRRDEWRALRERLLRRVGPENALEAADDLAELSVYLRQDEGDDALARGDLRAAEVAYSTVQAHLASQRQFGGRRAAACYYQLGRVAEGRQEYESAEQRYRRALALYERLGLARETARQHQALGRLAQRLRQPESAERRYRRALVLYERLGLARDRGRALVQLGQLAEEQGRLGEAEPTYQEALELFERHGLERDAADVQHQLGLAALVQGRLEQAEQHYRQALATRERLRLEREAGREYHQLARIAQERGAYDEAERRYRRAFELFERLGVEAYAADECYQLGRLAEERQRFGPAEAWYRRALAIYEQLGQSPDLVQTLTQLGALQVRQERFEQAIEPLGRAFWIANGFQMPAAGPLLRSLSQVLRLLGEERFGAAWRRSLGDHSPPLTALRMMAHRLERAAS